MIAADYARAVGYLDHARFPAYVSFVEQADASGIAREHDPAQRLYVRISDGAIVKGVPPANADVVKSGNANTDNPFSKHEFFEPRCYTPAGEDQTRWNGQPAIRFRLQATCDENNSATELYVDPATLRPIAVDGNVSDSDSKMTVAIELRYTTVGPYTVPSSIRAHAVGHGWLFWARERAEVDYTAYQFYQTAEFTRIQASKP